MHKYIALGNSRRSLSGDWTCHGLMSSYDSAAEQPWEAILRIRNHWGRIQITMESGGHIAFFSQSAAIEKRTPDTVRLKYLYSNLENADQMTAGAYFGHADITFSSNLQTGSGKYFNDEKRKTFGTFTLKKIAKPN